MGRFPVRFRRPKFVKLGANSYLAKRSLSCILSSSILPNLLVLPSSSELQRKQFFFLNPNKSQFVMTGKGIVYGQHSARQRGGRIAWMRVDCGTPLRTTLNESSSRENSLNAWSRTIWSRIVTEYCMGREKWEESMSFFSDLYYLNEKGFFRFRLSNNNRRWSIFLCWAVGWMSCARGLTQENRVAFFADSLILGENTQTTTEEITLVHFHKLPCNQRAHQGSHERKKKWIGEKKVGGY